MDLVRVYYNIINKVKWGVLSLKFAKRYIRDYLRILVKVVIKNDVDNVEDVFVKLLVDEYRINLYDFDKPAVFTKVVFGSDIVRSLSYVRVPVIVYFGNAYFIMDEKICKVDLRRFGELYYEFDEKYCFHVLRKLRIPEWDTFGYDGSEKEIVFL